MADTTKTKVVMTKEERMKKARSIAGRIGGDILIFLPLILMFVFCLVPFFVMISSSLSSNEAVRQGVTLFPKQFTVLAYQFLFSMPEDIFKAYGITFVVTVGGTFLNIVMCSLIAYSIADKDFRYGKAISFFVFFTVLFHAGLIPQYIVITRLFHLNNTIFILILVPMLAPGHILFMRVYFGAIDKALFEAARIDGASEFRILFNIALPLITPGLVTCIFQFVILYWNDATTALYFADDITPIALYIQRWQQYVQDLSVRAAAGQLPLVPGTTTDVPDTTVQFAMGTVSTVPMIIVFLFFQKYYVRGLTVGGVKG